MYVSCPSKKIDPVAFSDDGVLDSYDRRHVHMMSALRGGRFQNSLILQTYCTDRLR